MSKKMALPDELLDLISGGILTYGGKPIIAMDLGEDGWNIATDEGVFAAKWSAQDKQDMQGGKLDKLVDMLNEIDQKSTTHSLESFGWPGPK